MKKTIIAIIGALIVLTILFWLTSQEEKEIPETEVAVEEISPVTFKQAPQIPVVEDETMRRLREAGLDGGFATIENTLEK